MAVPNIFANVTTSIPLSQLDTNFATAITLGNTAVYLGNTTTTIGNLTLTNANVSSVLTPITPAQGGTGLATLTANNVLIGNGTSNVTFVAPGTSGNALISNGTVWASSAIPAGSAATQTTLGTVYGKMDNASPYNTSTGYQAGASTTAGSNVFMGYQAGYTNVSGSNITAVGFQAGYSYNGSSTQYTFIGDRAGYSTVSGAGGITAVGAMALYTNTTGNGNVAVGGYDTVSSVQSALKLNTTGSNNTAVGVGALAANTTGGANTAVGSQALLSNQTATHNVAMGYQALRYSTSDNNTAIGWGCLETQTTSSNNTCIGNQAGAFISTGGSQNICIGSGAGTDIFSVATESGRTVMGNNNCTNAYIKVAWTVTSDARDKTDITPATYGLDFVNKLKPITFKWDERAKYENETPDGSHKGNKTQLGFLAQDVIALEKEFGGVEKDFLIADDEQEKNLKITETKMIPALVKAIQELKAINETLTARIVALEAR